MQKITIPLFLLLVCFLFFIAVNYTHAQADPSTTSDPKKTDTVTLTNPLGETNDIPTLIGKIISAALGIVGSIALIMFIYGGFMWLTSAGNSEMVNKGRDAMIWAAVGLGVIFGAYALVHFVIFQAILGK